MPYQEYTLFDTFEYKGYWWLPNAPEKQVPGILKYGEDYITLELFGSLSEVPLVEMGSLSAHSFQTPLILGYSGNTPLTLYKNTETNRNFYSSEVRESTFSAQHLFLDQHFATEADLRFYSMWVNYTDLEEWIAVVPFKSESFQSEENRLVGTELAYTFPPTFRVEVPSLTASIGSTFNLMSRGGGYRSQTLEQVAFLEMTPKEPKHLDWYRQLLFDCQHFLALLIGQPVLTKQVILYGAEKEIVPGHRRPESCRMFFKQQNMTTREAARPIDMLVTLPAVRQSLPSVLGNWFSKLERLRDVINLYFGTMYSTRMYLETHFLNLLQALESYSRSTHAAKYLPDDEYQNVATPLLAAIPPGTEEGLKASLKSRIKYGNEYSLRKRLDLIFKSLEEETMKLFCKDLGILKEKVVNTRNYFTHYAGELKEEALHGEDLYWLNQRLRLLLTVLLLKEVGIDEDSIRKALLGHPRLMQVIHLYLSKENWKA